jgi:hypothetical protein
MISRVVAAAAAVLLAAACSRPPSGPAQIRLVVPGEDPAKAFIEITGLSTPALDSVRAAALSPDAWSRLVRVTVKGAAQEDAGPPIAGRYRVEEGSIRFTPSFPFDPGREYAIRFDPATFPFGGRAGTPAPASAVVSRPADAPGEPTAVTDVYPSAGVLPENQLRMYIHFSAPMGRRGGLEHVTLIDDRGREVREAFLPLDAELWNSDRTRFTLFFDPGRVKRGILPNRRMGRALRAGRRYTLVVRREWTDGRGQPLKDGFSRTFLAGDADTRPVEPARWRIEPGAAGTVAPLVVVFPEPLDHGLAARALEVTSGGETIPGAVTLADGETRWSFTPRDPWRAGDYTIVVNAAVEDLAGNRIGHPFEVKHLAAAAANDPTSVSLPFRVVRQQARTGVVEGATPAPQRGRGRRGG